MAYTLKGTGLAAEATTKVILAVDEDGTLKEFKNGWTPSAGLTKHADVTTSGTASFRSAGTKKYFQTGNASGVPKGVAFTTNVDLTTRTANRGFTVVCVMAGFSGQSSSQPSALAYLHRSADATASGDNETFRIKTGTGVPQIYFGGVGIDGSTALPLDGTTKFTVAYRYLNSGTEQGIAAGGQTFYCLESAAGSSMSKVPASPDAGGFQPSGIPSLTGVGGVFQPDNHATTPGAGVSHSADGKYLLWAAFDRLLTDAEIQGIHDDWFGTLFNAATPTIALTPDPTTVVVGSTRTFTITRSVAAGVGGVTYNLSSSNTGVATVPATATIAEGATSATFNATGTGVGSADITATNAADSGETDTATLTASAPTTTTLKLLAHIDALGATAVKGSVFQPGTGGNLLGAKIGDFTGEAFESVAESGQAPLLIPVTAFGGGSLTVSDTPVVVWEATSAAGSALGAGVAIGSVGPHECTVVEI